jgi:hypothetical protein
MHAPFGYLDGSTGFQNVITVKMTIPPGLPISAISTAREAGVIVVTPKNGAPAVAAVGLNLLTEAFAFFST